MVPEDMCGMCAKVGLHLTCLLVRVPMTPVPVFSVRDRYAPGLRRYGTWNHVSSRFPYVLGLLGSWRDALDRNGAVQAFREGGEKAGSASSS